MKKLLTKIVLFFKKSHNKKYFLEIVIFIIALAFLMYLATRDVVSNVFGAIVGFLFSTLLLYIFKLIGGMLEDLLKINYNTDQLLSIYHGRPDYKKTLCFGDTSVDFIYADVYSNEGGDFHVEDHPDKFFELDGFIEGNYAQLFSAHSNSTKMNFDTIRLDDFDESTRTFYLSRSTYFNHLVTNRAVDFYLFDNVSLRDVYEYGPALSPLAKSKMSNHIGINALVFLSDGGLLIPRRKNDSTISKNKITSSIAIMLSFPSENMHDTKNAVISAEYLLRGNIIKNLSDRTKILPSALKDECIDVEFLGFGQNVYEGGKPQFYYAVHLSDIDTAQYYKLREAYFDEQKRNNVKERLDVDKLMYVADMGSFEFEKGLIKFRAFSKAGKAHNVKAEYEMSYLCNIWHYLKSNEKKAQKESSLRNTQDQ